ncbi:MAG: glutamate 5-kinase [Verrucomicrobiales bacterium]|nr:glutamate 5-kinase [Verrucomicrobiales bacterium]
MRAGLSRNIKRVVIKLGTGVLTDPRKRPDLVQFAQLVAQVAALRARGAEVVLVTSGAVGAGMGALGFERRPADLADLQACAAVGQSRLMALYESLFRHYELSVGQVLLTHDDLADHARHLNARNTLRTLLARGIVPVINENDAVSVTELKFGDNDRLSALVACLLPADLLVILTTADGLIEGFGGPAPHRRSVVEQIDASIEGMASGTRSATAVGGMITKILAAKMVARAGVPLVIAPGRKFDVLPRILDGEDEGTLFQPQPTRLSARKRWIAFFQRVAGSLVLDDGAVLAVRDEGRSLLAPGIRSAEGEFAAGDLVSLRDAEGREFARGLARRAASEIGSASGRGEVVHRDDLVIL